MGLAVAANSRPAMFVYQGFKGAAQTGWLSKRVSQRAEVQDGGFSKVDVLVCLFFFRDKHHGKEQLGEERVFWLTDYSPSWRQARARTQSRRNLEAGTGAETMEECCLLACYSWLSQLP